MKKKNDSKRLWNEATEAAMQRNYSTLVKIGLEKFFDIIEKGRVLTYKEYLNQTEISIDQLIVRYEKEEKLSFFGGYLYLELGQDSNIKLTAKLYFKDAEKKWILITRDGSIDSIKISDWDVNPDLIELKKSGKIEYPIEAPEGVE